MIRDFRIADYHEIKDPIDSFAIEISDEVMAEAVKQGICVTAVDDEGVLGCGGAILTSDSEAELWCRLSQRAQKRPVYAIETIAGGMKIITESLEGVRFTCKVVDGFKVGERFAKWLGFETTGEFTVINEIKYLIYRL